MTHRVMFCCNDERGQFAGQVEIVEVGGEARLVCQKPRPPTMKWHEHPTYTNVQVGRRSFACQNGSRQVNVGNVFWDSASMTTTQARLLIAHLLETGWTVEEHAEDGPFADLVVEKTLRVKRPARKETR